MLTKAEKKQILFEEIELEYSTDRDWERIDDLLDQVNELNKKRKYTKSKDKKNETS